MGCFDFSGTPAGTEFDSTKFHAATESFSIIDNDDDELFFQVCRRLGEKFSSRPCVEQSLCPVQYAQVVFENENPSAWIASAAKTKNGCAPATGALSYVRTRARLAAALSSTCRIALSLSGRYLSRDRCIEQQRETGRVVFPLLMIFCISPCKASTNTRKQKGTQERLAGRLTSMQDVI